MTRTNFKCCRCKKELPIKDKGGNYYVEDYCKECWQCAKKYIGKSWGGEVDDKGYSF